MRQVHRGNAMFRAPERDLLCLDFPSFPEA
jgi:hypothetical protein